MATTFRAVLPGTSGNYFSRADVNLLDADTAHCHQSYGNWRSGGFMANFALSTDLTPVFGDNHGECTPNGTQAVVYLHAGVTTTYPISASTEYSFNMSVASDQADMEVRVVMAERDGGGAAVSTVTIVDWTAIGAADTWKELSGTWTTNAGSSFVRPSVEFRAASGNVIVTDKIYFDAACLRAGSDASFVPSIRIVGDLDMRSKIAATDATPASAETIIGQRSGNSGYAMTLGTGGELVVYHGTGSGTRVETSSGLSLTAATATVVRSTLDISAGTWTHYKDGVQYDSSGSFATTAGSPYAGPLAVGADSAGSSGNWDGDIYYAEVRDGIDGPIVARFDADDWSGL